MKLRDIETKDEVLAILSETDPQAIEKIHKEAYDVKVENIGSKVYLRGLIELSNICIKNCLYCGIRKDNDHVHRYELSDKQVLEAAQFAWEAGYGSLVLQAGERISSEYVGKVTRLVREIKEISEGKLGISLSLGEQSRDVYREWFDAGAHRYLLRIESSNPELYSKIHPANNLHSWERRVQALKDLKEIGYQTGTGVMIGLPYQTLEDLADDLMFIKSMGIHMVGMGPYLTHSETPMGSLGITTTDLSLTLKMVAALRLLLPKINIAATTAMQVVDPEGREKAVLAGANIIMPNMTITEVRESYQIYENKPGIKDDAAISKTKLEMNLEKNGIEIGWGEWGDSRAFVRK
ncbi:MAG: [FeFe] hydrogenase H-cluster radical SAM maturase HydE [Bacteroidetes bacterium HGW-Bacteroidetes-10]|nr:MAG: [FeFe] hydrogenase H-cluster radical SAM maturase HydE [Bacteroidetes bacterium HGW-Bacteroidetes-10]